MAFDSLSSRLQGILKKIRGQAKITEKNIDDMLVEVRRALLEADVNYKVVQEFVEDVKNQAIGQKVIQSVSPSQMIVKIINDKLAELLGEGDNEIHFARTGVTSIMLVGLQGTGKTTSAGKLANMYKKEGKKVLLVAGDVYRPAAIDQLIQLGEQIGVQVYSDRSGTSPVEIAKKAYFKAQKENYNIVIIDTAGRLEIDETLMKELQDIETSIPLNEELLLVDALAGQNAVNVAKEFHTKVHLTGIIMSKLDSDARGGAALSIKKISGLPIKFAGVGEKIEDIETFHPDRMASRILGMGDVVSLVEKAQENLDQEKAVKATKKIMSGNFGIDDIVNLLHQIRRLGPLGKLITMLPGMPKINSDQVEQGEKNINIIEVISNSMTPKERKNPDIIKANRKIRIAKGAGRSVQDVNRVIKSYEMLRDNIKKMNPMMRNMIASQAKKGGENK